MFERSPFEDFKPPAFLEQYNDQIYALPYYLSENLGRPKDQAVYFVASISAIICCFILKGIQGETYKKLFSLFVGTWIHFFVFGTTGFATVIQNLLTYGMMVTFPDRFQHIAVFIASATLLGLSQLHKQFYKPGVNGLDVPMALMFNFCRATSLVSCVRDGIHIKECAEHNRKNPKN